MLGNVFAQWGFLLFAFSPAAAFAIWLLRRRRRERRIEAVLGNRCLRCGLREREHEGQDHAFDDGGPWSF